MVKKFTMAKPGIIEFGICSTSRRFTLNSGESILINCTQEDDRIIPALSRLGLVIIDYVEAQPTVVEPVTEPEPIKVEESIDVPVESVEDEPEQVYDEKKLMAMSKAKLVELAESLGIDVPEDASKKEIAALVIND